MMPEQDSSKVFRPAFNNMLERYFPLDSSIRDIANKTQLGQQTIRDFKNEKSNIKISNLEKILLNNIVCDEALNYFNRKYSKRQKAEGRRQRAEGRRFITGTWSFHPLNLS